MRKILFILGLVAYTTVSLAQQTPDQMTTLFFEKYETDTDGAFDYIFATNPWMQKNKDGSEKVKFQIREFKTISGAYTGFEKIRETQLGEGFKVDVYLVKYERQPLRFVFKYYKAKDTWVLYNLKFDDKIDEELDKANTSQRSYRNH